MVPNDSRPDYPVFKGKKQRRKVGSGGNHSESTTNRQEDWAPKRYKYKFDENSSTIIDQVLIAMASKADKVARVKICVSGMKYRS